MGDECERGNVPTFSVPCPFPLRAEREHLHRPAAAAAAAVWHRGKVKPAEGIPAGFVSRLCVGAVVIMFAVDVYIFACRVVAMIYFYLSTHTHTHTLSTHSAFGGEWRCAGENNT